MITCQPFCQQSCPPYYQQLLTAPPNSEEQAGALISKKRKDEDLQRKRTRAEFKIPVINLDIEERIKTMRESVEAAKDDQKVEDLALVAKALSWIGDDDDSFKSSVPVQLQHG